MTGQGATSFSHGLRDGSGATRRAAGVVAAALREGRGRANAAFDRLLPAELREVSEDYWTPIPVVRRVAAWLRAERVRTVVDIGSGAGKFGVATALLAPCHVIGLEQRPALVAEARALAALFGVDDRVRFEHGSFGVTPTPAGDAYYLFNPFVEYGFRSARYADAGVVFSEPARRRDVAAMRRFLSTAPVGTVVITYNGFGGDVPPSYGQMRVDLSFRGPLRLWKKQPRPARVR